MNRAEEAVANIADSFVPLHLRNNNNSSLDNSDVPYKYPHDYGGYVEQQYLPAQVKGGFYVPSSNGKEAEIAKNLQEMKQKSRN